MLRPPLIFLALVAVACEEAPSPTLVSAADTASAAPETALEPWLSYDATFRGCAGG